MKAGGNEERQEGGEGGSGKEGGEEKEEGKEEKGDREEDENKPVPIEAQREEIHTLINQRLQKGDTW